VKHQHIHWLDDAEEFKRLFTGQTVIKSPER
jgi:hypothetical protein